MKRLTMNLDKYRHVLPDGRLVQSEVGMPIRSADTMRTAKKDQDQTFEMIGCHRNNRR